VFLSCREKRALSPDSISRIAAQSLKRLGLSGGSHLLRRTVASHLVQKGASIKEVADLLGHKNLATTMIYAQVNLPMLRQVAMPWPKEAGQ
jgi:site-specific recombinase XerD